MLAYASRTGTRRNIAALRAAGWRLFVAALGVHRDEGFRFMIESSAFSFFRLRIPWHDGPVDRRGKGYLALLQSHGRSPLCDGIVAPDIVCGGLDSLRLSLSWLDRLLEYGPTVYLPVQPGMAPSHLCGIVGPRVAVFVGGDSQWKEETCAAWSHFAHDHGALCHVGRVNSLRRLEIVKAACADSFDGSGPSRYEAHLHKMERARRVHAQTDLAAQLIDIEGMAGVEALMDAHDA